MLQSLIALAAVAVLLEMSRRANRRFCGADRLPMQWRLPGTVIWTAPRRMALAFTPVLAACILASLVFMTVTFTPRAGQENLEVPVVLFVALLFVGIHALHIRLITKTLAG